MAFENQDQAAEALFNAVQSDRQESGDVPSLQAAAAEENKPEGTPEGSAQEQPNEETPAPAEAPKEDSFTRIDLNAVPDELKPLARSLQADYTRKTQEVAEQRKAFESLDEFGGVDAAREAVEFVTALSTDPNYALAVHEQLTQALSSAGLTPAQASREASRQINQAIETAPPQEDPDEFGLGVDPAYERKLAEMERRTAETDQKLAQIEAWRQQEEENRLQYAMMSEMNQMHADVVQKYNFDEDQMSRVYALAYSTGGDLRAAADVYNTLRDSVISEYIQQKASVPTPPNVSPTGGGDQPVKFTDLNDPGLERLVNQRLAHEMSQGNL